MDFGWLISSASSPTTTAATTTATATTATATDNTNKNERDVDSTHNQSMKPEPPQSPIARQRTQKKNVITNNSAIVNDFNDLNDHRSEDDDVHSDRIRTSNEVEDGKKQREQQQGQEKEQQHKTQKKKIERRRSTELYMQKEEGYSDNGYEDIEDIHDDVFDDVMHEDEEGMRSSEILYENPDNTFNEEDESFDKEDDDNELELGEDENQLLEEEELDDGRRRRRKESSHQIKKTRVERLRAYFKIPPEEELLDEFLCALHKKILLQGRMYVFNNYLCFYSSVFGYQKRKRIPFKEVTLLEKAKTAGIFNNALQIVHRDGKKEFFTSFIFPDKVFKFLLQQWRTSSDYGRLFRGTRRHESMDFDARLRVREEQRMLEQLGDSDLSDTEENSNTDESKISKMLGSKNWAEHDNVSSTDFSHEELKSKRKNQRNQNGVDGSRPRRKSDNERESIDDDENFLVSSTLTSDITSRTTHRQSNNDGSDSLHDSEVISEMKDSGENEERVEDKKEEKNGRTSVDDEEESEEFGEVPRLRTLPTSISGTSSAEEHALRIPEGFKELASAQFDCTTKQFFKAFFSNSASKTFFAEHSRALGQTNFSCSEWSKHSHYGFSRDLKFVAPVHSTFGPKETRCVQTQTYKLYADDNLVVGYSQVQLDIPYGDYFSVETKWNCVPISTSGGAKNLNACEVTCFVHVSFEKYTYLQSVIQSSVLSETTQSAQSFFSSAKDLLNKNGQQSSNAATAAGKSKARTESFVERISKRFAIDLTKVIIPEGSRDAVFSMLHPSSPQKRKIVDDDKTYQELKKTSDDTIASSLSGAPRMKELAMAFFDMFTIQNMLMFSLFVVAAWTIFICVLKLWYVARLPFTWIFGSSDANIAAYWERRIAILTQELGALERKATLISSEIRLAKESLLGHKRK